MIIRSMRANFGALSDAALELEPGLNVIEAPNESGKSTWCALLRVMLYGPENARGTAGGRRPDRERYAPWDGSPMWGRMELTWQGREITLSRSAAPGGAMRAFSAVYAGTSRSVTGLSDTDAGERLTGMSLEVFRRTAFIGPAGLPVAQTPALEKHIAQTIASGEEGLAYSEAAARLRAWQRQCAYRGQGKLPELEGEMEKVRARLGEIDAISVRLEETELSLQEASARHDALRGADTQTQTLHQQRELLELEGEILRRESEAEALRASLRESPLRDAPPDEALFAAAEADERRAARLRRELSRQPASRWTWITVLTAAVLLCAAGLVSKLFFIPGGAGLLAGAVLLLRARRQDLRRREFTRELSAILDRYGVSNPKQIRTAAQSHAERRGELASLAAAAEELRAAARQLSKQNSQEREAAADNARALTEAQETLKTLWIRRARLQERLAALGGADALREQLGRLSDEHARLEARRSALEMAAEELTAADEEMNALFAPALSRRTQEIFSRLTGERYEELSLSRELTASLRRSGEGVAHPDLLASRGTRDQLYLALRLALCAMTSPGEEPCPIVLDDALVTFDDERLGLALDYLRELARQRQILLFTCQSRERRYLGI